MEFSSNRGCCPPAKRRKTRSFARAVFFSATQDAVETVVGQSEESDCALFETNSSLALFDGESTAGVLIQDEELPQCDTAVEILPDIRMDGDRKVCHDLNSESSVISEVCRSDFRFETQDNDALPESNVSFPVACSRRSLSPCEDMNQPSYISFESQHYDALPDINDSFPDACSGHLSPCEDLNQPGIELPVESSVNQSSSGYSLDIDSSWCGSELSSATNSFVSSIGRSELNQVKSPSAATSDERSTNSGFVSEEEVDLFLAQNCDLRIPTSRQMPLYAGCPITNEESSCAILMFLVSEGLSNQALNRLLQLIGLHMPQPNSFMNSAKQFFTSLNIQEIPINIFYYCKICLKPRSSAKDLCDICTDAQKTNHYFVTLPLANQISQLFSRPGFVESLNYKHTRVKKGSENIEDVLDGKIYRDLENEFIDSNVITLCWNTDGISPYDSSTFSLWPFFFAINELPPEERFKKENMVIAGMWGSYEKPNPNVFLAPMYAEISKLRESGIDVTIPGQSDPINYKIVVCSGTCDTPAKATFFNLKHHSGYFSCPKCYIRGERSARTKDVLVFPDQDELLLRVEQSYREDVSVARRVRNKEGERDKEASRGIKGATILSHVVPNMIESTALDSMHCLCLGVTKHVFNLLFHSPSHRGASNSAQSNSVPYSLSHCSSQVNKRLSSISFPHFVQRECLPVEKLCHWKASLLRNVLFYVMLPLLYGIMKEDYFENLKLLVAGVALLNSDSISPDDIAVADALLKKFVSGFQNLYGLRNMNINCHFLRHLAKSVYDCGPLWSTSCFGFESLNGDLLSILNGTTDAGLQIASKLSIITELPRKVSDLPPGPTKSYCERLKYKFNRLNINERFSCKVFSVGPYTHSVPDCLSHSDKHVLSFDRLWKENMLYVALSYQRGSQNSSFVKYSYKSCVQYGCITQFVKLTDCQCVRFCSCEGNAFALVQPCVSSVAFRTEKVEILPGKLQEVDIRHIRTFVTNPTDTNHIVHVQDLLCVCFQFCIDGTNYLCEPLNNFELE